jgi:hypothetical protein
MKKLPAYVFFLTLAFFIFPMTAAAMPPLNTSCEVGQTPNQVPEGATFITLDALNLRPLPSTNFPRIALAPRGSIVYVTDFRDGEWYAVTFNGMCGFMNATWLAPIDLTPPPPPDTSNLAPVELVAWHTANELIVSRGAAVTIIDVRTGISWQVARLGGELHADVETVTAADTAAMHAAFDFVWTWDPRPVLVIAEGRTLAASIGGMPHSVVTNFNNNVNGHFCLHFFGSRVHGSEIINPLHHNAVLEAFFTAIMW